MNRPRRCPFCGGFLVALFDARRGPLLTFYRWKCVGPSPMGAVIARIIVRDAS